MKQIFKLDFISLSKNFIIEIYSLENFVSFLGLFDSNVAFVDQQISWNTIQQKDSALVDRVNAFINSDLKKYSCLKKLFHDFFGNLVEGECFFVLNHADRTTVDFTKLWSRLGQINAKAINSTYYENQFDWGPTVLNYNIEFFGTDRRSFGHFKASDNKICRFCQNFEGERNDYGHLITFRKKAHLISEALGNKNLISLDECDYCNEYFSQTIEPSIVNFFSPFRSLYGIPGKNGKKKLKGEDFELAPGSGFKIQYSGFKDDLLKSSVNILLNTEESYVPAKIYRCLVKFLLAILPREELSQYQKTIEWLFNSDAMDIPKVACLQYSKFYTNHPYLVKYKLHTSDMNFPNLIGEFRYADIVMVFIVPFCIADQKKFLNQEELNSFWDNFIGMRKNLPWSFVNFSSTQPVKMAIDLTVNNIKLGENAFLSEVRD